MALRWHFSQRATSNRNCPDRAGKHMEGGMDAVLAKLGKKLGRKPMLKRKGLTDSEPMKESGMTVVIGMGKPMKDRGAMAKRDDRGYPTDEQDDEPIKETSPEGLSAKLDALMERLDAIEAKIGMNDDDDEDNEDNDDMEEED
jgi:hypothetical protein